MFYPELLQICNENKIISLDLVKEIDSWLAFLPTNQQNKITIRKCSNLLEIDYNIAGIILEKISELGVIKKIFSIKCPDCGFNLKLTDEDNLVDDFIELKTRGFCYSCGEDIEEQLSMDIIEVRYELVKKPSGSPDDFKDTAREVLNVEEKIDTLGDLIEKANYKSNKLFYKPIEDDYERLETLLYGVEESIVSEDITTKEKGDRLEDLVLALLNLVKPFEATKKAKTDINQIDCLVRNTMGALATPYILNEMGHVIYCECKNEKKKPDNTYFHKLSSTISFSQGKTTDRRFCIIFSREGAANTIDPFQRRLFDLRNILLINFDLVDLKRIVRQRTNLLDEIETKVAQIMHNTTKNFDDLNLS